MSFGYGPPADKNDMIKLMHAAVGIGAKTLDCADTRNDKSHRLTENIGTAAIQLTAEELHEIETASSQINIVGTRYNEQMEKATGL